MPLTPMRPSIHAEALRLARNHIKETMKKQGYKVSQFDSKEITKAALKLMEYDDSFYKLATTTIENMKPT